MLCPGQGRGSSVKVTAEMGVKDKEVKAISAEIYSSRAWEVLYSTTKKGNILEMDR